MVPTGTRAKSTLFCPECDHESPVGGDWEVRSTTTGDVYRCPSCRTTVTARCRSDGPIARTRGSAGSRTAAGSSAIAALAEALRAWRRRVAPPLSFGSRP